MGIILIKIIDISFHKKFSTAMHGGTRTIIPLGLIEKMCNLNIMPTMLLKAIIARDIEMMEELGIYECAPEDFSLCAFIDISKMDNSYLLHQIKLDTHFCSIDHIFYYLWQAPS